MREGGRGEGGGEGEREGGREGGSEGGRERGRQGKWRDWKKERGVEEEREWRGESAESRGGVSECACEAWRGVRV